MKESFPYPERKKPKPSYRKPEAVKQLEELNHADRLKRFPNVPNLAYLKYRDDTANNLTKCVVKYIELLGGFASRINSTGQYRPELKRFVYGSSKKGIADVMGTLYGKSLNIEVKIGKDKQSEHQINVQHQIERSGGVYYIARNFTEFKQFIDNLN